MKCKRCQAWLYSLAASQPLPDAVQQHLVCCESCRKLRDQLASLDASVREMCIPPGDGSALAGLRQKLDAVDASRFPHEHATPTLARTMPGQSRSPWIWTYFAGGILAASLLLLLGWQIGQMGQRWHPASSEPRPAFVGEKGVAIETLVHLTRIDLRLAAPIDPEGRLEALTDMAGFLGDEALRLASDRQFEPIPALVGLYDLVIRTGIITQGLTMDAGQRAMWANRLRQQEGKYSERIASLKRDQLPIVIDLVQPLAKSALQGATSLETGVAGVDRALPAPTCEESLTVKLVKQGLKLVATRDALERAEACSRLSEQLTQSALLLTASGSFENASYLSRQIDAVLTEGVDKNLALAEAMKLDAVEKDHLERVRAKASQVTTTVEENLAGAPPEARQNLEKMLQGVTAGDPVPSSKDPAKDRKGKGPPWQRQDGKSNPPPGWLKKLPPFTSPSAKQ